MDINLSNPASLCLNPHFCSTPCSTPQLHHVDDLITMLITLFHFLKIHIVKFSLLKYSNKNGDNAISNDRCLPFKRHFIIS